MTRRPSPADRRPDAHGPCRPNPHLPATATAQDVFNGLGHAGLQITAQHRDAGAHGRRRSSRKIYATYLGWPLDVTEYRSATLLAKAERWKPVTSPATAIRRSRSPAATS